MSVKAATSRDTPKLLELPHQVGGRLRGFFYFREAAFAVRGAGKMLGEQVGIGGDNAEEIIERVRNGLRA